MPPAVWGDHFWSEDSTATAGYDALISRLNSSHSTIKALVTHYSERIVTEEEYVKKFSKTLKEDLSQNESGTVKETLVQIQNSLESALRAHEQLTSKLRDSLVSPLESFADNQKRLRKQVEGEHKRQADMLKIEFSSMEKCGKEYISRCKDVAKAEEKANQPIKEKQSQKDYDKVRFYSSKIAAANQKRRSRTKRQRQRLNATGQVRSLVLVIPAIYLTGSLRCLYFFLRIGLYFIH